MRKKHNKYLSSFSRQLISIVSVALVLLILGIVGSLGIAGHTLTQNIKENMGFNLVLSDQVDEAAVNALKQRFNAEPYISSYEYLSPEEILQQEEKEIGEDIVAVLGVNPYQPEFNIRVKAAYASVDSINKIVEPLRQLDTVADVTVHTEMVREINANIHTLSLILLAVALALMLISFVLINNTVRLSIYSRRFLLHTMRLVGATGGFIRRPIILQNLLNGAIAGVLACLMLCGIVWAVRVEPDVERALDWAGMLPVFALIVVVGMVICAAASWFATNKYLRQSYDDMF
jgi:cell division transport system permease protein